uniref:Uncharacterized protein n=1 Tax=Panagrolaimus sp. ES5 TaxID=591445 RepID=A0AC34F2U0_9BILA
MAIFFDIYDPEFLKLFTFIQLFFPLFFVSATLIGCIEKYSSRRHYRSASDEWDPFGYSSGYNTYNYGYGNSYGGYGGYGGGYRPSYGYGYNNNCGVVNVRPASRCYVSNVRPAGHCGVTNVRPASHCGVVNVRPAGGGGGGHCRVTNVRRC